MNMGIIILIAILALWGLGVFLGAIGGLTKPFAHPAAIDSSDVKAQEQKTIEETQEKQKAMMDDMKQKEDDMSQKY